MRLGVADYSPTGPNVAARGIFLRTVERCVPEAFKELGRIEPTEPALSTWAAQWGFEDEWLRQCARQILVHWAGNPNPKVLGFMITRAFWAPMIPAPSWDPTAETKDAYRARVEAYIADMEAIPGFERTSEKHGGSPHFEWLALHHVGRWTYQQIAERYQDADGSPSESAVSRAITDTAKLIDLTLRPGRGRPKVESQR